MSACRSACREDRSLSLCICSTAVVCMSAAALTPDQEAVIRYLAATIAALTALTLYTPFAHAGRPNPRLIQRISRTVFGPHWRTAVCIAHYESTDGAWLVNGDNLGPWQVNTIAHPWVDARRVVRDWWYAARVAYRISDGGRDWSAWSTARSCT